MLTKQRSTLGRSTSSPWRHLDLSLVGAALAIAVLGTLMVYSATRSVISEAGLAPTTFLVRQGMFLAAGIVVMVVTVFIDYRAIRDWAVFGYSMALLSLVMVLSPLGTEVNGSKSWFSFGSFQLQPAEFTKLAVIVLLASLVASWRGRISGQRVAWCIAVAGVPAVLILVQPDVGSMLVFVAVLTGVLVVGGVRPRHLVALALVAVFSLIAVFELDIIEGYQRERLTEFASEGGDQSGAGYNAEQAKIAIGAGGIAGAGLFEGSQTKLSYVPEQQTDFIFTVVGEELGFLGSASLLALYGVMCWRIWRAAQVAKDFFGTLACTGVLAMLLFQVFENVGMAMGMMPITGIPLPFMSYGGSSTLTMFAAIGLVLNIHTRRFS